MVAKCRRFVLMRWTQCDLRSVMALPMWVAALRLPCTGNRSYRAVVGLCTIAVVFVFLLLLLIHRQLQELGEVRTKLEEYMYQLQRGNFHDNQRYELSEMMDDAVLIYNRVPKTGSTSFVGIAYDLCDKNHFNVLHLNVSKNNHVLSVSDQVRFVNNITLWDAKKPALYHGHIAFLDFSKFGTVRKPLYINILRDPIDRLVSYYYFLRNGDNFRPYLKRRRAGNTETFDDCVIHKGADCGEEDIWMQVPFFCGQAAECWNVGSEWALQLAKYNLVKNYLLVGITEELGDFIEVLETIAPRYFLGASHLYHHGNKSHLRRTSNKSMPSASTIHRLQESLVWRMEQEFYEFAREQFHFIKRRLFSFRDEHQPQHIKQQFMFEKIRPR